MLAAGCVAQVSAQGQEQLADAGEIRSLKEFAPPKPVTPDAAQGYMPENQFDRTDRSGYYFVTGNIDKAMRPVKANSGFYGRSFYNSASIQARGARFYGNANINHTKAGDYKDGGGSKAGWGYSRFNQALVLGFVPSENQEYRLTYLHDRIDDDKQPQFANDAVKTDRNIVRMGARWGGSDLNNTLRAEAGFTRLDRRADNYSLRSGGTNRIFVGLDRKIFNFSLKHDYGRGKFHNAFIAGYQHDSHDGIRHTRTDVLDFPNAYRFAGIRTGSYRLSDTLAYRFDNRHKLGLGLGYEYNDAEVRKNTAQLPNPANPALAFASAQQVWRDYYGFDFNGKVRREAFSGELKYDFTPSELHKYSISAAHIERIGDNTERFNSLASLVYDRRSGARRNQNPAAAMVGNPLLKPEGHNFVRISADLKNSAYNGYMDSLMGRGWNAGGSLMYDKVKNLIIFDRARGQAGVAADNGGIIVRNADADIVSADIYARYNFNPRWAAGAKAFYRYGRNADDGRPLYQIRPFELAVQADYKNYFRYGSYSMGAAGRYVAKQARGDFDTASGLGIDRREAAKSFATADVYAAVNVKDRYGLRAGVNNIFNRRYADFISGDHVEALAPTRVVYAPGRTYWLSLHAAF
ncbi:TonB-dependent receptor [Neisseria sp.]|uniref:TonB-dependent receptor n=1 Tax=Neisseria sp. TaxID=192066 RepID=UPI0026DB6599|nr:TonB-dependent receptor [Neisseria sp.]MDO4907568.1 TonB-dependent receptor [Neisseria sp.]